MTLPYDKMPTHRLLALYRLTRKKMNMTRPWVYDVLDDDDYNDDDEVKRYRELKAACDKMKSILDTREHIEND